MSSIRIASWNILNDSQVPKHLSQSERIEIIVDEINKVRVGQDRYIQFLCECETIENIMEIATRTGLKVVGEPHTYRRDYNELFVFLADAKTAAEASVSAVEVFKDKKEKLLKFTLGKTTMIGCHMPYHVINEYILRKQLLAKILELNPNVFMGDYNATPIFPMRFKILNKGYKEAHREKRPPFPHTLYRGKNIHWWLPNINIDALYHLPSVELVGSGFSLNEGSDHPLIWADFEL